MNNQYIETFNIYSDNTPPSFFDAETLFKSLPKERISVSKKNIGRKIIITSMTTITIVGVIIFIRKTPIAYAATSNEKLVEWAIRKGTKVFRGNKKILKPDFIGIVVNASWPLKDKPSVYYTPAASLSFWENVPTVAGITIAGIIGSYFLDSYLNKNS